MTVPTSALIAELLRRGGRYPPMEDFGRPVERAAAKDERRPAGLSRRELEIAGLVTLGHTNRQVADELRISVWTVSAHLRRIFSKLGVSTRTAMASALSREQTGRPTPNGD
jgi:DNA-binding NarL/FixJ family response regulator